MTRRPDQPDRYHHGDLRNAVKQAALVVLAGDGPAALSLRQVAAQAGVSHTAPRHHFGDKRHLLTELATDGFRTLAARMAEVAAAVDRPDDRLPALLSAYVAHHRDHPGYAAIMWRSDLLDTDDPGLREASLATFRQLHLATGSADTPLLAAMTPYRLALLLWSLAHGVATLAERLSPELARAVGAVDDDLAPPEQLVAELAHAVLGR